MNRRGQVFLLLTILAITFITAISSVLLDIQRSQYIEPSADLDKTFEVWDNSVYAIEQIISTQIVINNQNLLANGTDSSVPITTQLDNLENYLNSRGFIASVNLDGAAIYLVPAAEPPAIRSMIATVSLQLTSSSGTNLVQTIEFLISYQASVSGPTIILTKIVNGETTFISGATITGPAVVTDNENGSYTTSVNGLYTIVTNENLSFTVTV